MWRTPRAVLLSPRVKMCVRLTLRFQLVSPIEMQAVRSGVLTEVFHKYPQIRNKLYGLWGMIFQPICRLYVKRWVAATSSSGPTLDLKIYSFVWFLLWLCKSVLLNTLPHIIQCFKILILFKKSFYIPIMSAIHSNSIFMQQLSVFTKYFCKTTWIITWTKL